MARLTPRPEATQEITLTPLNKHCEHWGQPLSVANHGHRTVTTLAGMGQLTLVIRQCIQPNCPRFHQPHRPEEEGRWALPHGEFHCPDWDVALSGAPQCPRDASGIAGARDQHRRAQCDSPDAPL